MTQSQVADALILDTQYYSQLERCDRKFTVEKIVQACELFDVGIEEVITFDRQRYNTDESKQLIENVTAKVKNLSEQQLKVLDRYIDEILPLI